MTHASAVSSGTAGLHLALRAAGVTDGDEVVTSPFSFVASANAVLTERTRALLPVHVFGYPADASALDVHGLAIVCSGLRPESCREVRRLRHVTRLGWCPCDNDEQWRDR